MQRCEAGDRTTIRWKSIGLLAAIMALAGTPARAGWIWVEGEKPTRSSMQRHPWYDQVKRDQLSGGALISNFGEQPGEAAYRFTSPKAGRFEFWVRANPIQARLSYRLNEAKEWTPLRLEQGGRDSINVAADDKPDLRFLAWFQVGKVDLRQGDNTVAFRMDSANSNHGYLDCFAFSEEPFRPSGGLRPDQLAAAAERAAEAERGWFAFDPAPDAFDPGSAIDLRSLNEKTAGEGGFIAAKDGRFIHAKTGEPIRFWAVNGPPGTDTTTLRREARILAKRGVNLVRVHHGYFDGKTGELDPKAVRDALEVVEAMKGEGIYSHFSIYFPLWMTPAPGMPGLEGYDGKTHPFAALIFNKDFQARYRTWWKALLTTPNPTTGRRLIDEPAVAGVEIQNEDSYFFWTFAADRLPDPQIRILEEQFGAWLKTKYGSIDKALASWGGARLPRDNPAQGRVSFRPLWNIANERTARDQDTARFLVESQRRFYQETHAFLRNELGFQGLITASNWATASPEVLGPLEKYTYAATDFIDRHGYFGGTHTGDNSAWSIRDGHVYSNRSALRFDPPEPGKPRLYVHPAMDLQYDDKPSMISETTWTRPNRYRSEAPLYYAVYGALQDSDAIVHFALDGSEWSVKPRFFMQPWTLMAPSQMGQFPAAALIYRKGLVAPGEQLVDLNLKIGDLLDLKGTPLPQDAALDELRLADVPQGGTEALRSGAVIDPLVHLAGRTRVRFTEQGGPSQVSDLSPYVDRKHQTVTSSAGGQVRLDYGKGVLTINAPAAQGASGALRDAGTIELNDLSVASGLELGHVVAVSLDGQPLARSQRILLQVMSEERPTGFRTEAAGNGLNRIVSIGRDPWRVREIEGTVRFKAPGAASWKVTALDANGMPARPSGTAGDLRLDAKTLYYLITP